MGQLEDTQDERVNWHWRNTMRPVRFFNLDARAVIPIFITLFHIRVYTIVMTVLIVGFFIFLERRGLTFSASLRAIRIWLVGPKRTAWLPIRRRRMVDYG